MKNTQRLLTALIALSCTLAFPTVLAAPSCDDKPKNPNCVPGGGGGDGGGGAETGHVSMNVTGAVDAMQDCDERLSADDTSYLCNKSGVTHYINLGDFFMNHAFPNDSITAQCFGAGYFRVSIGVEQHKNNSAEAVLRFWAYKGDGETEVLYVLRVNDQNGWVGDFPPAVGDTATMGELGGLAETTWDLGASNKKQERGACVDSGTFSNSGADFIKVGFTRDS